MRKLILIIGLLLASSLYAQSPIGRYVEVSLKNGFKDTGTIVSYIGGQSVTILNDVGDQVTYAFDNVSSIRPAQKFYTQPTYQAQYQPQVASNRPGKKSVGAAFLLSFLIPGGGQFYNGEGGKGAVMLLGAIVGAGMIARGQEINSEVIVTETRAGAFTYTDVSQSQEGDGLIATGAILLLGSALWSMIDAPIAAGKINQRNGYAHMIQLKNAGLDLAYDGTYMGAKVTLHF